MPRIAAICLVLISLTAHGQGSGDLFYNVTSERQATLFIKAHPERNGKIIHLASFQDTTAYAKRILAGSEGDTLVTETHACKIIEKKIIPLFRVSYIYLDGTRLSISEIDQIRSDVVNRYKAGTSFSSLVQQYTMDESKKQNGDLGWFREGVMVDAFEAAVRDHKRGDIFTVDIPESKWYYVVLKTHNDLEVATVTALQVTQ